MVIRTFFRSPLLCKTSSEMTSLSPNMNYLHSHCHDTHAHAHACMHACTHTHARTHTQSMYVFLVTTQNILQHTCTCTYTCSSLHHLSQHSSSQRMCMQYMCTHIKACITTQYTNRMLHMCEGFSW